MATLEENKELLDIFTMFTSKDQETLLLAKSLLLTSQFFINHGINTHSIVKFYYESVFGKKLIKESHINQEIIKISDSVTRLEATIIRLFIVNCLHYKIEIINS